MKRLLFLAMLAIAVSSCRKDDIQSGDGPTPPEQEVPETPGTPEEPEDPETPDNPGTPGDPEEDKDPLIGDYLYDDGTWSTSRKEGKNIIGIIYWVGDPAAEDAALKADHPECTHGLAVSLNQKSSAWQTGFEQLGTTVSDWLAKQNPDQHVPYTSRETLGTRSGYSNTKAIEAFNMAEENASWKVDAVENVLAYRAKVPVPESTSGWYLPSAKELSLMCTGEFDDNLLNLTKPAIDMRTRLNQILTETPEAYWLSSGVYWSSSEYDDATTGWMGAWNVYFEDGDVNISFKDFSNGICRYILAF